MGDQGLGQARLVAASLLPTLSAPLFPSSSPLFTTHHVHALTHTNANSHIVCVLSVVAGATRRMCNILAARIVYLYFPFMAFFAVHA